MQTQSISNAMHKSVVSRIFISQPNPDETSTPRIYITLLYYNLLLQKDVKNNGISGKWRLVSIYDGYIIGGETGWNRIPFFDREELEFANGQYKKIEKWGDYYRECTDTYQEITPGSIMITTNCGPELIVISKLSPTELMTYKWMFEGSMRRKYVAFK